MKSRSVAWYLREIKKRSTANPTQPVRLDIPHADADAVWQAFGKGRLGLQGRLLRQHLHIHPMLADIEVERFAFFGAQCEPPKPIKTIPAKDAKAADRIAERLKKSESDDLVIHPVWRGQHMVEVWQARDYIALQTRAWSGRELASFIDDYGDGILSFGTNILAEKGAKWGKVGNDHLHRMNASKVKTAEQLRVFIRKQYKAVEPQIRSKELLVKEAYSNIQDMVELTEGYRPSDSTINRALGKKDTKRKKK